MSQEEHRHKKTGRKETGSLQTYSRTHREERLRKDRETRNRRGEDTNMGKNTDTGRIQTQRGERYRSEREART